MPMRGVRSPDQEEEELGQSRLLPCGGDQRREGKGEEKERLSFKNHSTHSKKFICSLKLFLFLARSSILTAQGKSGS